MARGMMQRACPIEAVFEHAAPRLKAVQRDSARVAVSLEQLIRLLVSDGPTLEAALPRLQVQAMEVLAASSVHRKVPAPIAVAQAPTGGAEVPALPIAQAVATPTPVAELVTQDSAPTSEALWLPYGELEGLLHNSPGLVRPLMEALLLQSLASQAAESSAEPAPARQAA
ncbi:MAG: hypothetical protein RJA17_1332 [Pseudomonadota bacterium]|jgi:hypothetical protein